MSHLSNPNAKQITIEGFTMGVTYTVRYVDDGKTALPAPTDIKNAMENLLDIIHLQMSTYQDNSQISHFNQKINANEPYAIDPDFATVLAESMRLYELTEGGLNVSLGSLIHLWGFGAGKLGARTTPTAQQLSDVKNHIGMDKISLQLIDNQPIITKTAQNLYLDLSAIAKGFGVDKLATYLQSVGVAEFMVEIGGEIYAKGGNLAGQAWRIGIENPLGGDFVAVVGVGGADGKALATSGNYKDFVKDDQGNTLAHIIHPILHRPVSQNLLSLSVIADSAMTADGLATGLYALGKDKALEIASLYNLPVLLICQTQKGLEMVMTGEFKQFLRVG